MDAIQFDQLLIKKRPRFSEAIEKLINLQIGQKSPRTDFGFLNWQQRQVFLWNAINNPGERFTGGPYSVHPASAAFILYKLYDGPNKGEAITLALLHDLVDEYLKYDNVKFESVKEGLRAICGDSIDDAVNSSIILCGPDISHLADDYSPSDLKDIEKVATIMQVAKYGNTPQALTMLADKTDNTLTLESNGPSALDFLDVKSKNFIAYAFYAVQKLEAKLPADFIQSINGLLKYASDKYGVPLKMLVNHISEFYEAEEQHAAVIRKEIMKHQNRFGYKPR